LGIQLFADRPAVDRVAAFGCFRPLGESINMKALFARVALAACLLSSLGAEAASPNNGGGVPPAAARPTIRLCAQADGVAYTSDADQCDQLTANDDPEVVCAQARRALAQAQEHPAQGNNRAAVMRRIIAKTCTG
jgi:hypothetical protein